MSFADKLDSSRARSHSPNNNQSSRDPFGANQGRGGFGSGDGDGVGGRGRGYGQKKEPSVPAHPDNYNRYRTSQATVGNQGQGGAGGGNLRSRTQSPAAEQFKVSLDCKNICLLLIIIYNDCITVYANLVEALPKLRIRWKEEHRGPADSRMAEGPRSDSRLHCFR